MNCVKRLASVFLSLALLLHPAFAMEEADETEWVETMSSTEELAGKIGAAVLLERETGTVIYALSEKQHLPIASVTKIMTLLLTAERIDSGEISLEDEVSCSAYAASMGGSQIFLEEGEKMKLSDLIKSVAVSSANDAAVVLAEYISGSEGDFVELMNRRAKQLGMEDTLYANCTGLPCEGEHYSCAYDVGIAACALLSHDWIREYTTIWTDSVRDGSFGLSNTNKLIRFYPGATGLKTGFTQEAMYCLAASAERDGVEYVAIILHAPSSDVRFESAKLLLNHAFANYRLIRFEAAEAIPPVRVNMGVTEWIQPVPQGENRLLVKAEQARGIRREVQLTESVEAPVAEGSVLGSIRLLDESGTLLTAQSLVAGESVERVHWKSMLVRYLSLFFTGQHEITIK